MDRLKRVIYILKMTPHRQPDLVREATNRIISRQVRTDPQAVTQLEPLIDILTTYCDSDNSASRSVYNDCLSSVILTFQNQYYRVILNVLLEVVKTNGTARTVTAALQRIPLLVRNIQPIELGCDPLKLLKALIEVARRIDDESVLRALELALAQLMPYLDYHIKNSKEVQMLTNSLVDVLFRNLTQQCPTQIKRIAASTIEILATHSEFQSKNVINKLANLLQALNTDLADEGPTKVTLAISDKYVGLCICARQLQTFLDQHHLSLIKLTLEILNQFGQDNSLITAGLELMRDIFSNLQVSDHTIILDSIRIVSHQFLITENDTGDFGLNQNSKIIAKTSAIACLSAIAKQEPHLIGSVLSSLSLLYQDYPEIAVRNQLTLLTGNYIEAAWRFPLCVDITIDCEKVRDLWIGFRSTLNDKTSHVECLKSVVVAIRTCINTLMNSDHCVHIVEHEDLECIIDIYLKSDYKPLKVAILELFANIDFRTLHYIEKSHWSQIRVPSPSCYTETLQDRIVNEIVIASLTSEHQRIRSSAISTLISMIPNLYVTSQSNSKPESIFRSNDPIVSLAQKYAAGDLYVARQADEHINHFNTSGNSPLSSELHESVCMKNNHRRLQSCIYQVRDNPYNQIESEHDSNRVELTINLSYVLPLIKTTLENSFSKGKPVVSSLVKTLLELTKTYPIHLYSTSWDCRPSEYCDTFILLNFLLTYLESTEDPDVIVDDLDAYRNFISLATTLLDALCHENVLSDYENQRIKPFHKRKATSGDGSWSEITIRLPYISDLLYVYFQHLVKLLWLLSSVIDERNPFSSTKQAQSLNNKPPIDGPLNHTAFLVSRTLYGRLYKKLDSSYKSSKKNLNQSDEKFHQILCICLESLSTLLEYTGMMETLDTFKDILHYVKITSASCGTQSLACARQLLKSLFGLNLLTMYRVDPYDWFEDELPWSTVNNTNHASAKDRAMVASQGVYHHLVAHPYKTFSEYYSMNSPLIPSNSDKAMIILNLETRRALKVRRRVEDRIKSLFEYNPHQLVSPRVKQLGEILKSAITEFTPIVTDCLSQFSARGFCDYQCEVLHFVSYLILLRVNYQKLAQGRELIESVYRLIEKCGEKHFSFRKAGVRYLLRNSVSMLVLMTYERGPSKPIFPIANIIHKLDDLRATLTMTATNDNDLDTYLVPILRVLVEDLFIYKTRHFMDAPHSQAKLYDDASGDKSLDSNLIDLDADNNQSPAKESHDANGAQLQQQQQQQHRRSEPEADMTETEREIIAQKIFDVIDNPKIYDVVCTTILESRQNSSEIKYKKLSQSLLSTMTRLLRSHQIDLCDYQYIELTRKIIENMSPEIFKPVNFVYDTLVSETVPPARNTQDLQRSRREFQRWMSLVAIVIHILITQGNEDVCLNRFHETMTDEMFVEYLLNIAQLCMAEILEELFVQIDTVHSGYVALLIQQLSSYLLYLSQMFQSGLFFQLSRCATNLIKRQISGEQRLKPSPQTFRELCAWARDPSNVFSLGACERMFSHARMQYPHLTIFWSNVMSLLNNVDCNRDFWRDMLVYECHHCKTADDTSELNKSLAALLSKPAAPAQAGSPQVEITPAPPGLVRAQSSKDSCALKRQGAIRINRPSSLNLFDLNFNNQLRRSFIKRIADVESLRDKTFNRNIIDVRDNRDGHLVERKVNLDCVNQCLSPDIELNRRGALCLALDYVAISMNDVEHITWLIIHHISDIIRWSHEQPIAEFICAVHGNSASSGIFIQAVHFGFTDVACISMITRLFWTLSQVHYTQYGSLVMLLIEKFLTCDELLPYRAITTTAEDFACSTVKKLLNETNKNLVATKDELINQLTTDDLEHLLSLLNASMYPHLTTLLKQLSERLQQPAALDLSTASDNLTTATQSSHGSTEAA